MVEAAILTCRWLGLCPTHPSQRYGLCLRCIFMVNLPHGQEIQGSLGVRSLLLRSILRLVRLNGLSVAAEHLFKCSINGFAALIAAPVLRVSVIADHDPPPSVER